MLIRKSKKKEKFKFTKKRKLRDQFWGPSNIFTYKYWSPQHTRRGGQFCTSERITKNKKKNSNPKPKPIFFFKQPPLPGFDFSPPKQPAAAPHPSDSRSPFFFCPNTKPEQPQLPVPHFTSPLTLFCFLHRDRPWSPPTLSWPRLYFRLKIRGPFPSQASIFPSQPQIPQPSQPPLLSLLLFFATEDAVFQPTDHRIFPHRRPLWIFPHLHRPASTEAS